MSNTNLRAKRPLTTPSRTERRLGPPVAVAVISILTYLLLRSDGTALFEAALIVGIVFCLLCLFLHYASKRRPVGNQPHTQSKKAA